MFARPLACYLAGPQSARHGPDLFVPQTEKIDRFPLGFGGLPGPAALQFLSSLSHRLFSFTQFGRDLLTFFSEPPHHLAEFPAEPVLAVFRRVKAP